MTNPPRISHLQTTKELKKKKSIFLRKDLETKVKLEIEGITIKDSDMKSNPALKYIVYIYAYLEVKTQMAYTVQKISIT